jgi:PTS system sucrose-specific IIC component
MSNIAQGAATLAVRVTSKDKKQRNLASSASVSALLGITEPAMFGINLKLKFPFYCALAASAFSCVFAGLFGIRAGALGAAGLIGFISIVPKFIPQFLLCSAISFAVSFILTFVAAKRNFLQSKEETGGISPEAVSIKNAAAALLAPLSGKIIPVAEIPDPVFSEKVMGDGVAILPESDTVLAPADCTVASIPDTGHAYGLETSGGLELLIHIGIDTVKLNGKGFTPLVREGDSVKAGTPLCKVDFEAIKSAGYKTWTPVIITNMDAVTEMGIAAGKAEAGKTRLIFCKKTRGNLS